MCLNLGNFLKLFAGNHTTVMAVASPPSPLSLWQLPVGSTGPPFSSYDDVLLDSVATDPFAPVAHEHDDTQHSGGGSTTTLMSEHEEDHGAPFDDEDGASVSECLLFTLARAADHSAVVVVVEGENVLATVVGQPPSPAAPPALMAEASPVLHSTSSTEEDDYAYDEAIDREIRERTERDQRRRKYHQTAVYCGTYVAQGLASGGIGPTLLLLAENTSSNVDDMGLIFTLRGVTGGRLVRDCAIAADTK